MNQWKKNSGIKRLYLALGYSLQGLSTAYRNEAAFRQELWVGIPAILVAFFLPLSWPWRISLIVSVLAILIIELLNSAIEAVVDRISTDLHPLSKNAKDFGSAAVFLTMLISALVWACALWQIFRQVFNFDSV